ncbi:hypothetical protein Cfor_07575 [Coptotermes formosanus]|uniref:Queuine tRNA-ribosyltransferase accessory subunit 2 n=1 Tax=Coptotermes formosanus TaxID=36987 RepID=A0A6L2Q6E5_COPFO|nr:hypothetical protein Cfor_07575 [Coptotermes formosanus]
MKFLLTSVASCSNRIGCIKDIERLPGLVLETPLLLLYTKGGSVPHLTYEVLQMVSKEQHLLHIPISTVAQCYEAVSAFKKGIADFIGLKEYLTFNSIHDPAVVTPHGFSEMDTISIWPRNGRKQLDADKYMDIIEAFQPDMYQVLCDGDTNTTSSKRRVQKSVDRSITFFERCIKRHEKSEVLKNSAVLGVVEGGYSVGGREMSAKYLANSSVFGYVIDGLHNNGPDVEHLTFGDVKPILKETLKHLPNEKFRLLHGCWNPEAVLNMVELGIDAFDSSYAYIVTERGGALIFQNAVTNLYAADFTPISRSCSCLTCQKHTRAYVHHLLNTRELLGPVLLTIHNLHHYMEFFKSIREALKSNTLDNLRKCARVYTLSCHETLASPNQITLSRDEFWIKH